jgi:hypothetical protein
MPQITIAALPCRGMPLTRGVARIVSHSTGRERGRVDRTSGPVYSTRYPGLKCGATCSLNRRIERLM